MDKKTVFDILSKETWTGEGWRDFERAKNITLYDRNLTPVQYDNALKYIIEFLGL